MTSLVSIIIPTYNRADLITETLDSVLGQTYQNWECLIIDDGSIDHTAEVIKQYLDSDSRFLYFIRSNDRIKGASSCRNFGIEKAKGNFVIFLDSDDLLGHSCLTNRIDFILLHPNYDFWIFKMSAFENNKQNVKFVCGEANAKDENSWSKKKLLQGIHPFLITGPLWKTEVLVGLGGFNEELTLLEDLDLHLRALKEGFKLKYANQLHSDCFCRKDPNRKESYDTYTLNNHYIFFKKHLDINEKEMITFFQQVFNNLIFRKISLTYYLKFYNLGNKKKILKVKNGFYGLVVLFYNAIKISTVKGLGYNYFKTQFNDF